MEEQGVAVNIPLEAGQLLGDYEILGTAGIGGMGLVYKARQRSLGRVVALKLIRSEIARVDEYRDRFLREARLAAAVDHPHVVSVYDIGDESEHLFLAMQWIDGEDLKRILQAAGRLEPQRAVTIAGQIARALDAVHAVGLIHRDVKPANVLVRQMGGADHAYLTDFGVAKPTDGIDELTKTGWVVGTAGYLSPEQIRGQDPGPRSDLYGLGCVLFEALTGRPPFTAENEMALRWAHANDPRPTASEVIPTLGSRYDQFFAAALAVDPQQRFGSGREFAEALHATGQDTNAPTAPIVQPHSPTAVGPPTPIPLPANTPPPAAYPAYGYATPPPTHPQQSRSGSPLALIVLGVVALAGIAAGVLATSGVFSHKTPAQPLRRAAITHPTVTHPTTKSAVHSASPSKSGSSVAATAGTTSCGGDLSVGPNTSCGFAQNVEQAYDQTTGGPQTVTAFSPATGVTYSINCSRAVPHICTGGTTHDASVYFRSGPPASPASAASPPSSTAGLHACDQNIYVNANTSCKFAENIFYEYTQSAQDPSGQVMTIYSPITQQDYAITCTPDSQGDVDCSSNTNSYATFSEAAVNAYTPAQAAAYASSANLGDSNPN